ncbi:uncharacterized protein BO66DRAFT_436244 [Aspergillus aculeatinus CBS 121060]|uniref:Uncharacterized protein n=1 Tax=Aspergillus aculeatinus CBS 121060 TaxID=1448322 RepID=A0ACD1HFL1_9EURO|nr:hypothetical protein BO66DRAFT_436244 [Aspergillus aculeatinus CBS 121060]RAH72577.1 hypothetical protein BO66DRAFT_436244 [Aspergillus aculeatinus CBS 121060]
MGPEESYPPPYQNPETHPSTITIPSPAYITIDPFGSEEVHKLDHFPPKSDDNIETSFTNPAKSTATATISEPERLHQPTAALPKPSLSFKPITAFKRERKRKRNPSTSNPYAGTLTRKRELLPLP